MPTFRPHGAHDRTVLWLACVLALCAGYYIAFYRLGAAIDAQHDMSAGVAAIIRANRNIVAAGPQLERTQHDVDATLRAFDLHGDHATTVARFIRECARIATQHDAQLTQIDERRNGFADSPGEQHDATDAAFETIPLDVTLGGSYRELVGTIRGLAQAQVAMRIEIAAIDRIAPATGAAATGPLVAHLHIGVERLSDGGPASAAVPPAAERLHARSF